MEHKEQQVKPLEVALAKQITIEMVEHDMSQSALADAINVSRGAMNRYLNNHASLDYGQIIDIAAVFGLDASELILRAETRLR